MTFPPLRLQRRPRAAVANVPGRTGRESLIFPLPSPVRTAVIDADFHLGTNMRGFESGDLADLLAYAPEALALPLGSALALADRKLRGLFDLPGLKSAIVVLSSLGLPDGGLPETGPITPHHRDLLWKAFGLPVFEQLRGWDGRVMARECEVHDGLHFDATSVTAELVHKELIVMGMPTGFSAEIERGHCECGSETPRLRHLAGARIRAAAAAA